jgi:hypothetical protein
MGRRPNLAIRVGGESHIVARQKQPRLHLLMTNWQRPTSGGSHIQGGDFVLNDKILFSSFFVSSVGSVSEDKDKIPTLGLRGLMVCLASHYHTTHGRAKIKTVKTSVPWPEARPEYGSNDAKFDTLHCLGTQPQNLPKLPRPFCCYRRFDYDLALTQARRLVPNKRLPSFRTL